MATNKPYGDGHRNGAVKHRSQVEDGQGDFIKRDTETGRFMALRVGHKFKGVRLEHH